jgi:hypothetical protein
MERKSISSLQEALEIVEALSIDEQEALVEVLRRRLTEQRRGEIAISANETLKAIREGKAHFGTVDELKRDLLNE